MKNAGIKDVEFLIDIGFYLIDKGYWVETGQMISTEVQNLNAGRMNYAFYLLRSVWIKWNTI